MPRRQEFVSEPHADQLAAAHEGAAYLLRGLDMLDAPQVLGGDREAREQWWRSIDFDTFERLMHWMNGLQCNVTRQEHGYSGVIMIDTEQEQLGPKLTYCGAHPAEVRPYLREAFNARQALDFESGVALMGLVTYATHGLLNGHKRLGAQGYSLLTRGYNGSPQDQAYYLRPRRYHLNPVQWGLTRQFSQYSAAATDMGRHNRHKIHLDGVSCPPYTTVRHRQQIKWGEIDGDRVTIAMCEEHMNLATLVSYMALTGIRPKDYSRQYGQDGRLITAHHLAEEQVRSIGDIHHLWIERETVKRRFIKSLIDWFAESDHTIYGPSYRFMAQLRQQAAQDV